MPNPLNDDFVSQPDGVTDFLRAHPLEIDLGYLNPTGPGEGTHVSNILQQQVTRHQGGGIAFDLVTDRPLPVYCDLEPGTAGFKGTVKPKFYTHDDGGDYVQLYYLPWEANRRHTMDLGTAAAHFMTASMHGCRFEVDRLAGGVLHVSHSNVEQSGAYDAQSKLPLLKRADQGRGARQLKFGKSKYHADAIKLLGSARHRLLDAGVQPEDVLEADPDDYKANVVGKRTGPQWSFYYQLWGRVTVQFHQNVRRKKWLGLRTQYIDQTNQAVLPYVFLVKEIYPQTRVIYKLHKRPED